MSSPLNLIDEVAGIRREFLGDAGAEGRIGTSGGHRVAAIDARRMRIAIDRGDRRPAERLPKLQFERM